MLYWPCLDYSDPDCWDIERDVLPVLALARLKNRVSCMLPIFDRLDKENEPWRFYHGVPHPVDMLIKSVPVIKTLPIYWRRALVWSIVLHDANLIPGAELNELCCSKFSRVYVIKQGFPELADPVEHLVHNTQFHLPLSGDSQFVRVNNALLDLDLSPFAAPTDQVAKHGELLFKEMLGSIPYQEFRDKQWYFIDKLLKRRGKPFYRSPEFVKYAPVAEEHTRLILAGEL